MQVNDRCPSRIFSRQRGLTWIKSGLYFSPLMANATAQAALSNTGVESGHA